MGAAALRVLDHRGQTCSLGLERCDLSIHPVTGVDDERTPLGRILCGLESLPVAFPGEFVLEELADLGQGESGVVAQTLDEAQPLEIARVVQAVVPVRPGGRLEQADLLVVADRTGGQAGLGGDFLDPQERGVDGCRSWAWWKMTSPPNCTTTLTLT